MTTHEPSAPLHDPTTRTPLDSQTTNRVVAWLLVLVGFALPLLFCRLDLDALHDGILYKPALDVAQGRMLFRDSFTQYGALTTLLQAGAITLFGERVLSIRILTALFYGATLVVFHRVWSRFLPKPVALLVYMAGIVLSPYLVYLFLPWSSVYALFFQGLALLFAIRHIENGRWRELFFAGVWAAASHWCRQPVGLFLVAALVIALPLTSVHVVPTVPQTPRQRLTRASITVAAFLGGVAFLSGGLLAWIAAHGALRDYWRQSFQLAYEFGSKMGGSYSFRSILRAFIPTDSERMWGLIALLAAAQALWSFTRLLRSPAKQLPPVDVKMALAGAVAMSSWPQYFPVPCTSHCYWASVPMFGVVAYFLLGLHRSIHRPARWTGRLLGGLLGALYFVELLLHASFGVEKLKESSLAIDSIPALHGLRVSLSKKTPYDQLAALLGEYHRTHPDGTIITTTQEALYPALQSKQAVFHPMHVDWLRSFGTLYPEARQAREDYARRAAPLIVGPWDGSGYDRVARIWNGTLDILVPQGSVMHDLFDCRIDPSSDGDSTFGISMKHGTLVKSILVETVRGGRIADERWDTIPNSGHPGLSVAKDGAPWVGPKASPLVPDLSVGQILHVRVPTRTNTADPPADDLLISLCLDTSECQRRSLRTCSTEHSSAP